MLKRNRKTKIELSLAVLAMDYVVIKIQAHFVVSVAHIYSYMINN